MGEFFIFLLFSIMHFVFQFHIWAQKESINKGIYLNKWSLAIFNIFLNFFDQLRTGTMVLSILFLTFAEM